jgi:5-methylcytosine-specific restriction endonuclease McrA
MRLPSSSNPLLFWDPAAADPAQRRIHPLLRGAVLHRDQWTCRYCGGEATEVDHVDPRARGGATTPANLVGACRQCNKAKGTRTPEEWHRDKTLERVVAEARRRRARPRPYSVRFRRALPRSSRG